MKVDEILKNVTEEIANMISTKTVIGDALTIQGKTIIPVTSVSFGFGSGGGEGRKKDGEEGVGGGGGGGAIIKPVAFLVVSEEDVRLLSVKGKGAIQELTEIIPEIAEKIKSIKGDKKKEEKKEEEEKEQDV
ncbi:MAG: sporulation protein [Candidatus Methanoperedenaceae archaeon]|nr:sporulation protein [Candidatus Methanoperedenaceae archaeon]